MTQDQGPEDTKPSPPRAGAGHLRPFTQIILPGKSARAEARHNEDYETCENSPSREDSDELDLPQNQICSVSSTKTLDWDQLAMPKRQSPLAKHSTRPKKWMQAEIFWDHAEDDESIQDMNRSQLLSQGEREDNSMTRQTPVELASQLTDKLPSADSLPGTLRAEIPRVALTTSVNHVRSSPLGLVRSEILSEDIDNIDTSNSDGEVNCLPEYEKRPPSDLQETKEQLWSDCKEELLLERNQTKNLKRTPAPPKEKTIEGSNKKIPAAKYKKSPPSTIGYKKSRSKHKQKSSSDSAQKLSVKSKKQFVPDAEEQPLCEGNQLSSTTQDMALTSLARDFGAPTRNQITEAEQFYLAREQALSRARSENDISAIKLKIWKGLLPEDPPQRELNVPQLEPSQLANKKLKQKEKYESYDDNLLQASELPDDLTLLCGDHFALLREALYIGWGSDGCQKKLEQEADLFTSIRQFESRHATYFEQNETARKFLTILDLRRKTYQRKLHEQRKISKLEQQLTAFNDAIEMLEHADVIISANDMCLRDQFHRLTLEMKEEIADRLYDWRQQRAHIYNNLKVIWNSIKENATAKLVNLTVAAMLPDKPNNIENRKKMQQNEPQSETTIPASSKPVSPEEFYLQLYKSFTQQRNLLEGEIIDRMQDVNILTHQAQDLRNVQLQEKYNLLLLEAQRDLREVERLATNLEEQANEAANKVAESEQIEQVDKGQKAAPDNYCLSPMPVNRYYMLI
ncbi:hypothetical protein V1509DRAFT_163361 [Lipomyces kononenkoae]